MPDDPSIVFERISLMENRGARCKKNPQGQMAYGVLAMGHVQCLRVISE